MSNCTECTKVEKICEEKKPCGCPIQDLSTDCVKYDGEPLSCSGISTPNTLTQIIKKLDEFICNKFENTFVGELLNIGTGAKIYKQTNPITGRQEVRTLKSTDGSVTITQDDNVINFSVENITDNFLTDVSFDSQTGLLTFTMEDGTEHQEDISQLQQTQSNVLELDTTSPAYIKNKNKVDTVSTDYSIKAEDNNKVILLDTNPNGTPLNITVNLKDTNLPLTQQPPNNDYFVGFLQKGAGTVNFINGTPPDNYNPVLLGQGHNAAVEIINGQVFLFGALTETP